VTGILTAGQTGVPADLAAGDVFAQDGVFCTGDGGASNIDHIWHDDTANAWHFVSDAARKASGNSGLRIGVGSASIPALMLGAGGSGSVAGVFSPADDMLGLVAAGVELMRLDGVGKRVSISAAQFYVAEQATALTGTTPTVNWDLGNVVTIKNNSTDGIPATINVDAAGMFAGGSYIIDLLYGTGGGDLSGATWTGVDQWERSTQVVQNQDTVGNITTVILRKNRESGEVIASYGWHE
jgi:hypothetical protein